MPAACPYRFTHRYGRPSAERGWHFLVAEESLDERETVARFGAYPGVEALADALGFRYQWMPRQSQFAHPGVTMLLTPDARVVPSRLKGVANRRAHRSQIAIP